jgi:hypothetical protein
MNDISPNVASWVLDAWRKMAAQLQLSTFKGTAAHHSPAVIVRTNPKSSIISVVSVDLAGQNREWAISLEGAQFMFGVVPDTTPFPEFTEGIWRSFLSISFPDGRVMTFGERFEE